jgi:hypothetical protein
MSLDDLAFALLGDTEPTAADLAGLRPDVNRLRDLALLAPGEDVEMHPWTAALVTRNAAVDLAPLHEQALAMRYRRFNQRRTLYEDLIDVPRHLAALGRYDDAADDALDTIKRFITQTLATCAYLAEVRSLIPATQRAWGVVADMEVTALIESGDLSSARQVAHLMLQEDERQAAVDPANTQWQRDLSFSHIKLGDTATSTGDLDIALSHFQAALYIIQRLTDTDPTNPQWQRDLEYVQERLRELSGGEPTPSG